MASKKLVLTVYGQNHVRKDWQGSYSDADFSALCEQLAAELGRFGIEISACSNDAFVIDINSYADLLNAVRISSPADGFANKCIGHIIGKSRNLDLLEDISTAVKRVAFAPETIPPDDHNRRVCHNCGCGC